MDMSFERVDDETMWMEFPASKLCKMFDLAGMYGFVPADKDFDGLLFDNFGYTIGYTISTEGGTAFAAALRESVDDIPNHDVGLRPVRDFEAYGRLIDANPLEFFAVNDQKKHLRCFIDLIDGHAVRIM